MKRPSRHALNGDIIKLRRGLAIYKTNASQYYFARVWHNKKYEVRSTKEVSTLNARRVAEEIAMDLRAVAPPIPRQFTFEDYAVRCKQRLTEMGARGEINKNHARTQCGMIDNKEWGLKDHFRQRDVRQLKTRDYQEYLALVRKKRPDLSSSTLNNLTAAFRNVLKIAREDGVIDFLPSTPRATT